MEISENTKPNLETSSSIHVHNIPEWFLFEILCRLPWTSVFRFKCVSKQFLTLINDPAFVRIYISGALSSSRPLLWTLVYKGMLPAQADRQPCRERLYHFERNLMDSNSPSVSKLVNPGCYSMKSCRVVAISNGLCLCACDHEESYSIFNPVTKHFVLLPTSNRKLKGRAIAFHAHFDQVGVVNYKVAHFLIDWSLPPTDVVVVEEFSSETYKWTSFTAQFPEPLSFGDPLTILTPFNFKGILHWVYLENYDGPHRIISYDPIRIIHCPASGRMLWCGEIVTAGGEQTIRCIRQDVIQGFIYVWRLKDYEKGIWQLDHKFSLSEILLPYASYRVLTCGVLLHVTLLPWEPDILYFWGKAYKEKKWMLVSFNFCSKKSRVIDTIPTFFSSSKELRSSHITPFVLPPWPAILPHPSQ